MARRAQEHADRQAALSEAQEDAKFRAKHDAFLRAFPNVEAQSNLIARYRSRFPSLPVTGQALRSLVISAWWSDERRIDGSRSGKGGCLMRLYRLRNKRRDSYTSRFKLLALPK